MTKTVGGIEYDFGKLSPRAQFHVVRRILPVMASATAVMQQLAAAAGPDAKVTREEVLQVCAPAIMDGMGRLPDADLDYVLDVCLGIVKRKQDAGGWAPIMAPVMVPGNGGTMMFADITMPQMIELAYSALEANVGNFFDLLPSV